MNLKPFAVAGLVVIFCASVLAAEQDNDLPDEDVESLDAPMPDRTPPTAPAAEKSSATENERKASLPYSPYPAGLTWVLTPQPFYAQIRHHGLYYPPHSYVRRCPYYPRGYYWGANWRYNVIGRGNLLFLGMMRFNPYLTAAKSEHHKKTRGHQRYAPPPGPIGQAELLGSQGPGVPVALPPTSVPGDIEMENIENDTSGRQTKAGTSPRSAVVRPAAPRGTAKTVSSRQRSKSEKATRRPTTPPRRGPPEQAPRPELHPAP